MSLTTHSAKQLQRLLLCLQEVKRVDVLHLQAELTELRYKLALAELQKLGSQPEEFERRGELIAGAPVLSSCEDLPEDCSALFPAASIISACLLRGVAWAP